MVYFKLQHITEQRMLSMQMFKSEAILCYYVDS